MKRVFPLLLCLLLVFSSCREKSGEYIMTVKGPVEADNSGLWLSHEHILVDFIGADSISPDRYIREEVIGRTLPLIRDIKSRGCNFFVECTPQFLGRDPLILKALSDSTGVNFITNTGYYGFNNKFLPEAFYSLDAKTLTEKWTDEFFNGIEGTGIRPGFIKIAVNPADSLSPADEKIITTAALTHLKTGLTIASHTGAEKPAFEQIEILRENGVHPSAFIWVHAQSGTIESNIEAAKKGSWISLDNIRNRPNLKPGDRFSIDWYADRLKVLKDNMLIDRILLSHDSGWYDPAKPAGGTINGFTDIFEYLIPALKSRGFTDSDIDQLLIKSPAAAFTINIRKLP